MGTKKVMEVESVSVQVSFLEIYNEEIYDLLTSTNGGGRLALGGQRAASILR